MSSLSRQCPLSLGQIRVCECDRALSADQSGRLPHSHAADEDVTAARLTEEERSHTAAAAQPNASQQLRCTHSSITGSQSQIDQPQNSSQHHSQHQQAQLILTRMPQPHLQRITSSAIGDMETQKRQRKSPDTQPQDTHTVHTHSTHSAYTQDTVHTHSAYTQHTHSTYTQCIHTVHTHSTHTVHTHKTHT